MKPQSIHIYLPYGDPEGIRSAWISQSTTQIVAFRKLQLSQVKQTFEQELSKTGIYLLLGYDESSSPVVYIGQAEKLLDRLQEQLRGADKDFWTDTIIMCNKDESLTASHARYVEARLIADAQKNVRWNLINIQRASEMGKLPLPDRDSMEIFIENAKTLVGALGCDLFKVIATDQVVQDKNKTLPVTYFTYQGSGFDANLCVTSSQELVLQKGSKLRVTVNPSAPEGVVNLRNHLQNKGALQEEGGYLVLTSDCPFKSASAAAAMVSGASMNGRLAWKTREGQTFADWEKAQNLG